ncbi:MAG: nickel pincer cofactor biosynthesis protein LarC [Methanocellales archaeon]|nr:nickel pincer cofactor biosynthesis protein LarC [Methanocellales archaeon]
MMKAVVFNPFSGLSGDMIVASLLDIGANKKLVKDAMTSVGDVDVQISKANKLGISATKVKVKSNNDQVTSYKKIIKMIKESGLGDSVIEDSVSIYERISDAESKVYETPKDRLRSQDVGGFDAIADVIGACAAFHNLGLDKCEIYSTPICRWEWFENTTRGGPPITSPIIMEIIRNSCLNTKYRTGPVAQETINTTGVAILAHFINECNVFFPKIQIKRVGYGEGGKHPEIQNLLRTVIGETDEKLISDRIDVLEVIVDDITGNALGNLIQELMSSGAKDVAVTPANIKKGRPGYMIRVMAHPADTNRLIKKMVQEKGSLSTMVMPVKRLITNRQIIPTMINIGRNRREVNVKIATDTRGSILNISAEFEDCKKVAVELGVSVKEVIRMAECVAWSRLSGIEKKTYSCESKKRLD